LLLHDESPAAVEEREKAFVLGTYARTPFHPRSGKGARITDAEGREYWDLLGGIAVNVLGHRHPRLIKALRDESNALLHISNLYYHPAQGLLAERLVRASGLCRAFFCNSGTEAWETALKLARSYAGVKRGEGKSVGTKFLALEHSFHGRTMGSVSTTHKLRYREAFAPLVPAVEFVPFDDVAVLRAMFSDDVCAVCLEVIQGEGGIRPVSPEFLRAARALCDETGALLILDEIQAGLGRTGKWCAYQHYDVRPDITTLAKPLAGGLPLGAMLCTEEAARGMQPGLHGTTFGGGPLACAVAIAVVDTLEEEGLLAHVTEVGGYFKQQLERLWATRAGVVDVRGMGLMLAIELESVELAKAVAAEMLEQRILLNRTSDTVLRFLPPYILGKDHVDLAIAALDESLRAHGPADAAHVTTVMQGGKERGH
jgi:acetylornithine aminotransferase/acetylornithine/N-succinyldiaminopimelate aminotransferase